MVLGETAASVGNVLVVCGVDRDSQRLYSAELYNPATGAWTPAAGFYYERVLPSANMLSNGKVLVVGGAQTDTVEIYDPSTNNSYSTTTLNTIRFANTATTLSDGRLLVAGGQRLSPSPPEPFLQSAEHYNPFTYAWLSTGWMTEGRYGHTATLLQDGRVLVVGGATATGFSHSAELWHPATGIWSPTGGLRHHRYGHTATLLPEGKVLVAGGLAEGSPPFVFRHCEVFDPNTERWTTTGPLNEARMYFTATALINGKVLVVGGTTRAEILSSAELYDPDSQVWTTTADLGSPLLGHTATLLTNGRVLVVGGSRSPHAPDVTSSAHLFDAASETWIATGSLSTGRLGHAAVLIEDTRRDPRRPFSIIDLKDPHPN
jgi:N-acetylneuraminic acid mutarotase